MIMFYVSEISLKYNEQFVRYRFLKFGIFLFFFNKPSDVCINEILKSNKQDSVFFHI